MSARTAIQSVAVPVIASTRNARFQGERETDVDADVADGRAAEAQDVGNLRQLVGHQRDVSGFERGVCAGDAHRNPHVSSRERRRVVDPITDHRKRSVAGAQLLNRCELLLGEQRRAIVGDARRSRRAPRREVVVAGQQHDVLDAVPTQHLHRVGGPFADFVAHPDDADRPPSAATMTVLGLGAASALHRPPSISGPDQPRSANSRWLPTTTARAPTCPCAPSPGSASTRSAGVSISPSAVRTVDDRAPDRMLGSRLERGREREDLGGLRAVERHDLADAETALGQRPGLVERHTPHRREPLEPRAALDEHALARSRGQSRDDRDGRRDDERAWARDDEQHQRSVDPRAPGPPEAAAAERRPQPTARARSACRRARTVDERLARRALRLRALDEMDDPRQRRVAAQPRDRHVERAAAVDRPGEHFVARLFSTGSDSPVIGAWLTWLSPACDAAVERNLLARPDDDDVAHGNSPRLGTCAPCRRGGRAPRPVRGPSTRESRRARVPWRALRAPAPARRETRPMPPRPIRRVRSRPATATIIEHVNVEAAGGRSTSRRGVPSECRRERPQQRRKRARRSAPRPEVAGPGQVRETPPIRARDVRARPTPKPGAAPRARARRACPSARRLRQSGRSSAWRRRTGFGSRWPTTSASKASRPVSVFSRCSRIVDLLVTVHSLNLEDRFGVQFANRTFSH